MKTETETRIIEKAIEKGIKYILDDENDVCQAISDYTYPLCSDETAQSYWTIEDEKRTRKGNHPTKSTADGFELQTFVYAHGVYEGFTGRTMRLRIDVWKDASGKITRADFSWKNITN
jgi:hypothetical protein